MSQVIRPFRLLNDGVSQGESSGKGGMQPDSEVDALLDFAAEDGLKAETAAVAAAKVERPPAIPDGPPPGATLRLGWPPWASAAIVLAVIGGLAWSYLKLIPVDASSPQPATVTIVTQPPGAEVLVDGQTRGVSPLSLSLDAGAHTITLRQGGEGRVLPLTLAAGADVTHHVEFRAAEAAPPTVGGMSIVTDPPGAQVQLDGQARGVSPLTVTDLEAADYRVRVSGPSGAAERIVTVEPGTTASVVFSLPRVSSPPAGWLAVSAPFDVEVSESGNVVGTGTTTKIMLPAGRHTLSFTNERLRYAAERMIDVVAGQTMMLRIEAPLVPINVNARPWADIIIDGVHVGQTPIANLEIALGTHDVVFRHPELGDRRQTVTITASGPYRIAVDLTK